MARGNHRAKDPGDLTPQGKAHLITVQLTKLIKQIGNELHTVDDEGRSLTKIEVLARLVWDKSLGYTEKIPETREETRHSPDKFFISMLWDRLEGKVPTVGKESEEGKSKLSDKIGEQQKKRLNQLADGQ
jgi:hypothetical protein